MGLEPTTPGGASHFQCDRLPIRISSFLPQANRFPNALKEFLFVPAVDAFSISNLSISVFIISPPMDSN